MIRRNSKFCGENHYIWWKYSGGMKLNEFDSYINKGLLRIQFECGEIQTRKTPNTYTFHAVSAFFKSIMQGLNQS